MTATVPVLPPDVLAMITPAVEAIKEEVALAVTSVESGRLRRQGLVAIRVQGGSYRPGVDAILRDAVGVGLDDGDDVERLPRTCQCAECDDHECQGDCDSCQEHDCSQCHPDGCDCDCSSCHDSYDGCDECNEPDEDED